MTQNYIKLLQKSYQKLSQLLSKGFEKSNYLDEYKTKSGNKNMTNEYRYLLSQTFQGLINRLFWFIQTQQIVPKSVVPKKISYQTILPKIAKSLPTERTFITNLSHFDIIRIIKALENSGILNGGVSETVKCQIKKQEGGFLGMY